MTDKGIINRLRELIGRNGISQAEFARRIGMDPSNLSKHLNGHLPVSESLLNRVVVEMGVSKEWLKGSSPADPDRSIARMQDVALSGTPVYDIDVTAGFAELSRMFTNDRVVGYINLPQISPDCAVVRVSGDSMQPLVNNESLVAISREDSRGNIFWGQMYVVVLDDYRMVKFVRRHEDDDKVVLRSAYPDYDDMVVDRKSIRSMYLVETVVNISRRY